MLEPVNEFFVFFAGLVILSFRDIATQIAFIHDIATKITFIQNPVNFKNIYRNSVVKMTT